MEAYSVGLLVCQATMWIAVVVTAAVFFVSAGLLIKELALWALETFTRRRL